jgi:50S ribosomal protein L16 3-hydroxylase
MKKTQNKSNSAAPVLTMLGDLSVSQFMAEYWHRKPLLVRQAFADFKSPVDLDLVLQHAVSDDAEARLIEKKQDKQKRDQWLLTHGPLDQLPKLSTPGWTVLMQGADTQSQELSRLLGKFRFLPDARLDDLMISVASDQGGVGPHLDSYDVFLLQAHGQRHWRWGQVKDQRLQENQPVKLLANFKPSSTDFTAVLEPGDMLYLPPGWAHDGIAQGTCMTFSIGFRASTYAELMSDMLGRLMDDLPDAANAKQRIVDKRTKATKKPAQLEDAEITGYLDWIDQFKPSKTQSERLIAQHLTEPRQSVDFEVPERVMSLAAFKKSALKKGVEVHEASKALYRPNFIALNGDIFDSRSKFLRTLFDEKELNPIDCPPADWDVLHLWYSCGWIVVK